MTRLELAKHTVDTIYGTLLTLVNEGLVCPEEAEDVLFRKSKSIRESFVNDDSISYEEFVDFLAFIKERINFFRDIYLSVQAREQKVTAAIAVNISHKPTIRRLKNEQT